MPLLSGSRIGPYEIVAPAGSGGMGEVYRARDTRLDRTVAIKILPAYLSERPDAKQRFEREAKAISSLQHPNICTLFDIGSQNGTDFLVMEYLEGETLADRLTKGPSPSEPQPSSSVQPMSPPALDRVVQGCLAKDPDERWQTAHDVKLQLQWIAEGGSQAGIPAPVSARRRVSQNVAWTVAGVFVLATIGFGVAWILRSPSARHTLRVSVMAPDGNYFRPTDIALSPDGSKLAFAASD